MKTRMLMTSMIIILISTQINAQDTIKKFPTNQARIAFAKKNILLGLRSDNVGVVEGSLILVAKIKMKYPETNIAELRPVIDSIAYKGFSNPLRYKANVTSNICSNPEWFAIDNTLCTLETDWFFASAARLLQQKMLSTELF